MTTSICAPTKFDVKNDTCFTEEQLIEMAKAYNLFMAKVKLSPLDRKINMNVDLIKLNGTITKKYLLSELKSRFESVCHGDEYCLTQQTFMNELVDEMYDDILEGTFRTMGPHKKREWLRTDNINDIMKQYESVYSDFKFLGAVPLDCNDYSHCSLHSINYKKYIKNGINKFGIIFNHDKFGKPGSHWVALYIDVTEGQINYCDSTGNNPIENINNVINTFNKFYESTYNTKPKLMINRLSYQTDSSECGVYACNFIIRRLGGESFDSIVKNSLSFEQINSCRNVYFRNQPSSYEPHPKCDP